VITIVYRGAIRTDAKLQVVFDMKEHGTVPSTVVYMHDRADRRDNPLPNAGTVLQGFACLLSLIARLLARS